MVSIKNISTAFSMSLLGKILGFLKFLLLARAFGLSQQLDFFIFFYGLTLMFEAIVLNGAVGPNVIKQLNKEPSKPSIFIGAMFGNLLLLATSLTILLVFLATELLPYFYDDSSYLYSQTLSALALSLPFMVLTQLCTYVHQARSRYFFSTLNPILWNSGICFYLCYGVIFGSNSNIFHLALVVTSLYFISALVQFFLLKRHEKQWFFRPVVVFKCAKLAPYISLLSLIFFDEMNSIVDYLILGRLEIGAISEYGLSSRVGKLMGSLILASVITVFYTDLSKASSTEVFGKTVRAYFGLIFLSALGSAAVLVSLSEISAWAFLGEHYRDIVLPFMVFSFYVLAYSFMIFSHRVFILSGKASRLYLPLAVLLVVNLLLDIFLAELFGVVGVIFASLIVTFSLGVYLSWKSGYLVILSAEFFNYKWQFFLFFGFCLTGAWFAFDPGFIDFYYCIFVALLLLYCIIVVSAYFKTQLKI